MLGDKQSVMWCKRAMNDKCTTENHTAGWSITWWAAQVTMSISQLTKQILTTPSLKPTANSLSSSCHARLLTYTGKG